MFIRAMKMVVLLTLALIVLPILAVAAGFDCSKASNSSEKMICANDELSRLDEQLTHAYRSVMASTQDREALKQRQRAWIKERNQITEADAMIRFYQERLEQLGFSVAVKPDNPPAVTPPVTAEPVNKATSVESRPTDRSAAVSPAVESSKQETSASPSPKIDFMKRLALALFLGALVIGLFYGLTDRAIFYNDTGDFFFCFIPIAGYGAIHLVFSYLFDVKGLWVDYLAIAVTVLLLLFVIYKSCVLNNMNFFVGITVAVAKVTLGLFAFIQLYRVLSPGGKTEYERTKDQIGGAILLALCTILISKLVNGERVMEGRLSQDSQGLLASE